MNARLAKEGRDVLPILAGMLPVIALPCLIWRVDSGEIGSIMFGVACAVLAGHAFGNEFQQRTLAMILSQPIRRASLWWDKMIVLAVSIGVSAGVLLTCLALAAPFHRPVSPLVLGLVALCALSGGPFWTLMLRSGLGGMVAGAGAPSGILILTSYVTWRLGYGEDLAAEAAAAAIVVYCAVVGYLGFRQFERLQVLDGVPRDLSMPAGVEAAVAGPLARLGSRFQGMFATLLKKELRVQQVTFLLAGVYVLIAVAGFVVCVGYRDVGGGILVAEHVIYCIILPLIAGGVSLGEERSWGLAEWHATLPPSMHAQWKAKLLVALSTSLALGLLLPGLLLLAGGALLGELPRGQSILDAACGWMMAQLLLTSTAVYAATFARNTLWAILSAFLILCAGVFGVWLTGTSVDAMGPAPLGLLGHPKVVAMLIRPLYPWVLLLLVGMLVHFASSNFRRHHATPTRVLLQLAAMLLSAGVLSWLWFSTLCYVTRDT